MEKTRGKDDVGKRQRKSLLEMAAIAVAFIPRFGMDIPLRLGEFTPTISGVYGGPHTMRGRVKHAGETRRIKKRQRRRAHMRSLRG